MNSLLLTLSMAAAASVPAQPHAMPQPLAPVLYVKVIGPAGMKVTFHPGTPGERTLTVPAVVGLRPGYLYRLALSVPQMPNVKLYPTLEVRGALQTTVAQAMRHPVPMLFLDDELRRVERNGSMITKVHYLEDPEQAPPVATAPDEPLLVDVPSDADPIEEARSKGRPMVIVRLGEKEPGRDELVRFAVPNTILFPGEQRLPLPPVPPLVPWLHLPIYDPIAGAKRTDEECLPDGGDVGPRIGIGPDGKIGGFNASDTAIEYSTESGKRRVAVSNRVCVLVPRFAIARQELAPVGSKLVTSAGVALTAKTTSALNLKQTPMDSTSNSHLAATVAKQNASGMQSRVKLHTLENLQGVHIIGSVAGVRVVGNVKEPDEITAYPFCEPISLFKWAEPKEAQVGDIVTFYLRYNNHTKQFVENVVISDSLTARLEYIPGSARSDREAALTVTPNEAGSVILSWEISGKIPPGEKGVVAFQAKIR
jgi:uncharacterized repeat protein (TIGR01451 family)